MRLRGLTWQNPRGYDPLVATAGAWAEREPDVEVAWEALPWIDFEHRLIDSFEGRAEPYDLVMLDHPWVGTLSSRGWLRAWDELAEPDYLAELRGRVVAPSYESYVWGGRLWALPVDAACHAGLIRRDLVDAADLPREWRDIAAWAADYRSPTVRYPLVLSVSSVLGHCLFLALMQARGTPPYTEAERPRCDRDAAADVLEAIVDLLRFVPPESARWGPWDIYEHLTAHDDVAWSPQIFAYVNYFDAASPRRLKLVDCPSWSGHEATPILGGVGLAVSARSQHPDAAAAYARFTMSEPAQRDLFPHHRGQPAARSVWTDPHLNRPADGFYTDLLPQMRRSFVRPRYPGFHDLELRNADVLQRLWDGDATIPQTVAALHDPLG